MDSWLAQHLVCPHDRSHLRARAEELVCDGGHCFPYVAGLPIMLTRDLAPTQPPLWKILDGVQRLAAVHQVDPSQTAVDPFVQEIVAQTCGRLYAPLVGKLPRYPIPTLRLPAAHGERLLDVGSNWGRWTISAARAGYEPVGIDPSFEAASAAQRVASQLGVACSYVVADARRMPFEDTCFDVVFSYSVVQHFSKPDARLTVAQISRVLKPGGTSLVQMPNKFGIRSLYHQLRKRPHETGVFDVRYWGPGELLRAFSPIGPARLEIDGFFGLGVQAADLDLLPPRFASVVKVSERLRGISSRQGLTWMRYMADSLYVRANRAGA